MNIHNERLHGYSDKLRESSRFLRKGLSTQERTFILLSLLLSIFVFSFVLWLGNQSLPYRAFGYLSLFLIFSIIILNMKKLVLAYRGYLSRVLERKFSHRFDGHKLPLFLSLLMSKYSELNDINSLLQSDGPLVLDSLKNIGGSPYDDRRSTIWPYDHSFRKIHKTVKTKSQYYEELNVHLLAFEKKSLELAGFTDYCGEFGNLKDEGLLNFIEKLPEGLSYTTVGFTPDSKVLLDDVLDEIAKQAEIEETDPGRFITPEKTERIKRLVKQRKLILLIYGERFRQLGIPHMAEIGDYITLQQFHEHGEPRVNFIFKTPSRELREWVRNCMDEIKQSDFVKEPICEE